MSLKALVIGDTHFKTERLIEGKEFVEKIIGIASEHKPDFIILLGDILDRHEIVEVEAHNLVEILFDKLSKVCIVYVLMGNHDLINGQQFLTDKHIFGPFKKWQNIVIVDKPISVDIKDKTFVFAPYVPPGKFIAALDTLIIQGNHNWEISDCIFAHQEFKGCKMNSCTSINGDEWNEDYPLVISGHIHNSQKVGDNIVYTGSSMQQYYTESYKKYVWMMIWNEEDTKPEMKKLNLNMKTMRLMSMTIEELLGKEKSNKFLEILKKHDIKIEVKCSNSEFGNFQRTKFYSNLKFNHKVKIIHKRPNTIVRLDKVDNITNDILNENNGSHHNILGGTKKSNNTINYSDTFREVIKKKDLLTQKEYEYLFNEKL